MGAVLWMNLQIALRVQPYLLPTTFGETPSQDTGTSPPSCLLPENCQYMIWNSEVYKIITHIEGNSEFPLLFRFWPQNYEIQNFSFSREFFRILCLQNLKRGQ